MPAPQPPFELKDHCTIIHQNVLYVYTPAGFMSLALEPKAKWSELAMGKPVKGASCFKGPTDGDMNNPAFYVVGGTGGPDNYLGVQSYSFLDKTWRFPKLDGNNMKNRVNHDAIYLESLSSILVFAGSTDGSSNPSTETFMISTNPNLYHIESRGGPVPPSLKPVLLPWGKDTAILVGGSGDNKVYQFMNNAWRTFDYVLESPIVDPVTTPVIANPYIDGNMALQVFDFGASPITVRTDSLVQPGTPHRRSIHHSRHHDHGHFNIQKRSSYPAYNSTLAPSGSRAGASIASDPGFNNRVVISGGNNDEPIVIFNQDDNGWLDVDRFFAVSTTSSASSSTITATSSTMTPIITAAPTLTTYPTTYPTETETATSSDRIDNIIHPDGHTLTIIGATLGTLLGVGALIIIVLLLLAWRRRTSLYYQHTKEKHINSDDRDRFSFQDAGMEPLTQSIQPIARGPVPSTDSWAYVSGQMDDYSRSSVNPPPPTRGMPISEKSPSPLRAMEATHDERPDSDVYPPVAKNTAFGAVVDPRHSETDGRLTDEGWSKYFQGDRGSGSIKSRASSVDSKYSKSDYKSDYRSDYRSSGWPHVSAEVPPLRFGGQQPLGTVASGSPSTEHPPKWPFTQHQGMSAKISSADSISINSDDYYDDRRDTRRDTTRDTRTDAFSSGAPASTHDVDRWGRVSREPRVTSSNYSNSVYYDNPGPPPLGGPDRYLNPMPPESRAPSSYYGRNTRSVSRGILSSDISWLNIGSNR